MSISISGPVLTKSTKLTTSSPTTILQVRSRTVLASIICTETAGATPSLTIEIYDGSSSIYLRKAKPLAARETYLFNDVFALNAGQELRVTASAANQVDCLVTYFPNAGGSTA